MQLKISWRYIEAPYIITIFNIILSLMGYSLKQGLQDYVKCSLSTQNVCERALAQVSLFGPVATFGFLYTTQIDTHNKNAHGSDKHDLKRKNKY